MVDDAFDNFENMLRSVQEDRGQYHALVKSYEAQRRVFNAAIRVAMRAIEEIKKQHARTASLRICKVENRVKGLYSLVRKALAKDVPASKAMVDLGDVVGLRVVVSNLSDVRPFVETLKTCRGIRVVKEEVHGTVGGYRAVHLDIICSCSHGGSPCEVKCELQIRTLMQDAWATLAHRDFYKNTAALPPLAQRVSEHLSKLLADADDLADELRKAIEAQVSAPTDLPDEAPLDADGIAFLYYLTFGEKPQQYEVDYLLAKAREWGVATIAQARQGLAEHVLKKLEQIHQQRFWLRVSPAEAFEYGLLFAAKGKRAYAEYRRRVERDWAEVEAVARNEALAEMPETYEEMREMLEGGRIPWAALKELGGVRECMMCGEEYLDSDAAAEAISEHYDKPDIGDEIESYLVGTDCPESADFPGYCAYCGYKLGKDD